MITDKQKFYQKNKYIVSLKGKSKFYNYQGKIKSMIVNIWNMCIRFFLKKRSFDANLKLLIINDPAINLNNIS